MWFEHYLFSLDANFTQHVNEGPVVLPLSTAFGERGFPLSVAGAITKLDNNTPTPENITQYEIVEGECRYKILIGGNNVEVYTSFIQDFIDNHYIPTKEIIISNDIYRKDIDIEIYIQLRNGVDDFFISISDLINGTLSFHNFISKVTESKRHLAETKYDALLRAASERAEDLYKVSRSLFVSGNKIKAKQCFREAMTLLAEGRIDYTPRPDSTFDALKQSILKSEEGIDVLAEGENATKIFLLLAIVGLSLSAILGYLALT